MAQLRVPIVAVTLALATVAAARAQPPPPPSARSGAWTLRLVAGWVETDSGFTSEEPAEGIRTEASVDGGPALGLSAERSLGERLGVEFGLLAARLPATLTVSRTEGTFADRDDLDVRPFFVALDWHPRRRGRVDPWLGAGAAWVQFGDVRFFASEGANGEDDVGWLVQAGVDVRPKAARRLALSLSAVYLDATFAGEEQDEPDRGRVEIATLTLRAGLAVRLGG
jgi:outer membrane protein W